MSQGKNLTQNNKINNLPSERKTTTTMYNGEEKPKVQKVKSSDGGTLPKISKTTADPKGQIRTNAVQLIIDSSKRIRLYSAVVCHIYQ